MWTIVKRVLLVLLILVVAAAALLLGSILIDRLMGGGRVTALTNTVIPNPNGPPIRAYVARPPTPGPHPAVVMAHEFWGLKPDIIGKADALAQEGYVVVAPDLFRGHTTSWVPSAIFNVISNGEAQVGGDVRAVVDWLGAQPDVRADRLGITGFCFGGATALRTGISDPRIRATSVFYGSPITDPARLKGLAGPVLGIFGGADSSIPLSEVRAFEAGLQQAGIPHQVTVFDGQPHAFVRNMDEIRQGGPQGEAWSQMLGFFKQNLQGSATSSRETTPSGSGFATDWGYYARLALAHLTPTHSH